MRKSLVCLFFFAALAKGIAMPGECKDGYLIRHSAESGCFIESTDTHKKGFEAGLPSENFTNYFWEYSNGDKANAGTCTGAQNQARVLGTEPYRYVAYNPGGDWTNSCAVGCASAGSRMVVAICQRIGENTTEHKVKYALMSMVYDFQKGYFELSDITNGNGRDSSCIVPNEFPVPVVNGKKARGGDYYDIQLTWAAPEGGGTNGDMGFYDSMPDGRPLIQAYEIYYREGPEAPTDASSASWNLWPVAAPGSSKSLTLNNFRFDGTSSVYFAMRPVFYFDEGTTWSPPLVGENSLPLLACTMTVNVTPEGTTYICTNTSITLTATPTGGTAPYSYQWTQNGLEISGATTETYLVSKTSMATYSYNCKVTDSSGNCVSIKDAINSYCCWVAPPDLVDVVPDGTTTVVVGTNITFMAIASGGRPSYSFQWTENGVNIAGATNSTFSVTKTSRGIFYYNCLVSSSGCAMSVADATSSTGQWIAPVIDYQSFSNFTEIAGNGDGGFNKGEKWSVQVTLKNNGDATATNVTADLAGNDILICNNPGVYGNISVGATATYTYEFVLSQTAPCPEDIWFNLVNITSTELTPAGADQSGVFMKKLGLIITQSVSIADTWVEEKTPILSPGGATTMAVYHFSSGGSIGAARSLVRFDLSTIPIDATLSSATLELFAIDASNARTVTYDIHHIMASWDEYTCNWNNQPTYYATPDASLVMSPSTNTWWIWDVTSVVQSMICGTLPNYGFLVKDRNESTNSNWYTFATRENSNSAMRPVLRVTCTTPSSCTYAGTGACSTCPVTVDVTPNGTTTVCKGINITFTAAVSGGTAQQYQWTEDGADISGATNSTYTVSKSANGTYSYNCKITVSGCAAPVQDPDSPVGNWAVAPYVNVTPDGATSACLGSSIVFTVAASGGTAPYSYQWMEDGSDISGATNSTYSESKSSAGSHSYNCKVSSSGCTGTGQDGTSSVGSWVSPPAVDVAPDGTTTVYAGQAMTYSAAATGGSAPYIYQWTEDGSDIFGATNSSFAATKMVEESHTYNCKVASSGCPTQVVDGASSTGAWLTPVVPTVDVLVPDGGESWHYSADSAHRVSNTIQWMSSSSNGFSRSKLSYSTDGGTTWTCIADSSGIDCAAGTLLPGSQSFSWSMPTMEEAYAAGQTFPSDNSMVLAEVWDATGQYTLDLSLSAFTIANLTVPAVKTLILVNSQRIGSYYPGEWPALSEKLNQLAAHTEVSGVVLDLKDAPGLTALYSAWDGSPTSPPEARPANITAANNIASAVRDYIVSKVNDIYSGAQYLVLAGDDRIIPSYRVMDRTFYSEDSYSTYVSCDSPTGAPTCEGYYLSDAIFGDIEYDATIVGLHFVALPDLSTGRLVETPSEIGQTIDVFIEKSGKVNLNKVLVTGYDFLTDCAARLKGEYKKEDETVDDLIGNSFTAQELDSQLFSVPPHMLNSLNDHSDHYNIGTPQGTPPYLSTSYMDIAHPGQPLKGAMLYSLGCHSGLSQPDAGAPYPLDLPQLLMKKGAVAYVGNTGYGWGLYEGEGYHERLMALITDEILSRGTCSLGVALDEARRNYYVLNRRYEVFDEKVLMETALYGLPMYKVVVDPALVKENLPPLTAEGQEVQNSGGVILVKARPGEAQELLPPGVDQVNLNFIFSPESYQRYEGTTGTYYELNGISNGEVGDAIQPMYWYDSSLSGKVSHGVLFTGGTYTREGGGFNPAVGVPKSNNDYLGEGVIAPGMGGMIGTIGVTRKRAPDTFAVSDVTRLTVCSGYFYAGVENRFSQMSFEYFYANSSDFLAPAITDPGVQGFHTLAGSTADFSVQAADASGIYRVVVVYTDGVGQWKLKELAYNGGTGRWEGSLSLSRDITYWVQTLDNAGNVGILSQTGQDLDGNNQPYGSDYSTSKIFTTSLADSDSDGMPDTWETAHGLVVGVNDASGDPDGDLLINGDEYKWGCDPQDQDSDNDVDNDGSESHNGRDPLFSSDGKALTIGLQKDGDSVVINWPGEAESNGKIDGPYYIYRSTTYTFTPADELPGMPLSDATSTFTDTGATSADLYFYNLVDVRL